MTASTSDTSMAVTSAHKIKPLSNEAEYPLWSIRVQSSLEQAEPTLWDIKLLCPLDQPKAKGILISALADDLLESCLGTDMKASSIWNHFKTAFVKKDLSAKATSLQHLVDFNYSAPTMLANKSKLLAVRRELKAAFGQKDVISINDLTYLFALANVPTAYHGLRTTIQETSEDETMDVDDLFSSILREEANQTPSRASRTTTTTTATAKCSHGRKAATCWSCHPSLRPHCLTCQAAGHPKHQHQTGSSFCQQQQQQFQSKANTAIRFNMDSGATDTMVANKANLSNYSSTFHPIELANGSTIYATETGAIDGTALTIDKVLACSDLTENLLSVARLDDQGLATVFCNGKVLVGYGARIDSHVLQGTRQGASYYIDFPTKSTSMRAQATTDTHTKFNHAHSKAIPQTTTPNYCKSCIIAKATHGTVPTTSHTRTALVGQLVHSDLCGPLEASFSGARYLLTFTDDYSRHIWVVLVKAKSEVFRAFQELDTRFYNQFARHIQCIRTDNGGEFSNSSFSEYCAAYGIQQQFTTPYSPHQNGVSERLNLTLLNDARAALHSSGFESSFWDQAVLYSAYTRNHCFNSHNPKQTPYELFHGTIPDTNHLRTFGQVCYAITTPYERRLQTTFKLADRAKECKFIGYSEKSKSYNLLSMDGQICHYRYEDVIFPLSDKKVSSEGASVDNVPVPDTSVFLDTYNAPPRLIDPDDSDNEEFEDAEDVLADAPANAAAEAPLPPHVSRNPIAPAPVAVQPAEPLHLPEFPALKPHPQNPALYHHPRLGTVELVPLATPAPNDITGPSKHPKRVHQPVDYSKCFSGISLMEDIETSCLTTADSVLLSSVDWYSLPSAFARTAKGAQLPVTYDDIENLADKDEWIKATAEEIATLIDNKTWDLVPLPPGRKALKNKWVFRIKTDENGLVTRYKARLCACGYSQVAGIDYKDIFAPVVRAESLRLFLAVVAGRNMECIQMDVKSAFLNGKLDEEVYMKQPPGFVSATCPSHVCKLQRNLYGLKQAPRVWHRTIDPFLKSLGMQSASADPCIYYRWTGSSLLLIALYVDDLLIASDCSSHLSLIRKSLSRKFKMSDEGDLKFALGIRVLRDRAKKAIHLSSAHKINDILQDYNMSDCIPSAVPLDHVSVSAKDCPATGSSEQSEMAKVPYRECVGRLIYLMRTTRPDIAYPVSVASRFLANPGHKHWNLVKRILRYLKGTKDTFLTLSPLDFSTSVASCERNHTAEALRLTGNTDSDWAGDPDTSRSTSGYAFFLGSSLISWASKAQPQTATSSTQAEYIALYNATTEVLWLRSLLSELKLLNPGLPSTLYCDNQAAIKIGNYHMVTPRSKHFDSKLHLVRESISNGAMAVVFCPGKENVADIFTKPLSSGLFSTYCRQLGLESWQSVSKLSK